MSWKKYIGEICVLTKNVSETVRTEHFNQEIKELKELHQSLSEVIDPYSVRRNDVMKILQGIKFDQVVKYLKYRSCKEPESDNDVFLLWLCCALLPKLGCDRDTLFLYTMDTPFSNSFQALTQFILF